MYAGRIWKCKQHQISEHRNAWCEEPHNHRPKLLRPKGPMQIPGRQKLNNITFARSTDYDYQFDHLNIELYMHDRAQLFK